SVDVDDGRGGVTHYAFSVVVSGSTTNRDPVVEGSPRRLAWLGTVYSSLVSAEDPHGDPLVFELVSGPLGMTINTAPDVSGTRIAAPGLLGWEPGRDQAGTHDVEVHISDGRGGATTQKFVVDVAPQGSNRVPQIVSNPVLVATADQPYALDLKAIDPDG